MRIFMTGVTGLVGSAVAKALKAGGHDVCALVRTTESAAWARARGYAPVVGDMMVPEAWVGDAAAADGLIHLGALRTPKRLGWAWVRRAGTADRIAFEGLLEAARQGGRARAICYTSGISVFGDHGDNWIDEDAELRPGTIGSIKRAGERVAMDAFRSGLPAFCLRPGLVYGADGVFRDFFLAPASKGKLSYIGNGQAFHSTISIDDLARAYVLAIERPPVGRALNMVDDLPLRWRELGRLLQSGFGRGEARSAPPWLVSLFAGRPLVEMLTASYRVRNEKTKDALGWQPANPTLADGLAAVISRFRNETGETTGRDGSRPGIAADAPPAAEVPTT
jgi:nucleoside-diphosphate-sugar epimerase